MIARGCDPVEGQRQVPPVCYVRVDLVLMHKFLMGMPGARVDVVHFDKEVGMPLTRYKGYALTNQSALV